MTYSSKMRKYVPPTPSRKLTASTEHDVHRPPPGKCRFLTFPPSPTRAYPCDIRYFTAHSIPGHGTYVDGGLSFNNPALLALQEVQKLVPAYPNPDLLVTIGTGICVPGPPTDAHTGFARIFSSSSLGPAVDHYQGSFDGTRLSNELYAMLTVAGRNPDKWYRRFDLPIEGQLPDLADVRVMNGLGRDALAHFGLDRTINDLALAILASNFFIELRRMPVYDNGSYLCYSRILSRISVAHQGFASMIRRLDSLGARFTVQERLYKEPKPTILTTDHVGNFCKPVLFCVEQLDRELDVRVQFPNAKSYDISANRMTVQSLIERQRLDWVGVNDTGCSSRRLGTRCHVLGQGRCMQQPEVVVKSPKRRRDSATEDLSSHLLEPIFQNHASEMTA